MGRQNQLTLDCGETPIYDQLPLCLGVGRLLKFITRSLESMVDGLWISNPQAFFLCHYVSTTMVLSKTEAYPKRSIPANHGSKFVQEILLDDGRLFTLPPPQVSCSKIFETIAFKIHETQTYHISKRDSSVLEHRLSKGRDTVCNRDKPRQLHRLPALSAGTPSQVALLCVEHRASDLYLDGELGQAIPSR